MSNISLICRELFSENIIRGRGLLARSILQAQGASPTFTNVYAALVAIINTKVYLGFSQLTTLKYTFNVP